MRKNTPEGYMRLTAILENTAQCDSLHAEHGLSVYVETPSHKLLFDTGESAAFLQNAEKLGISIADVDLVVLSHGHYDHGGGLKAFFERNSSAPVYMQKGAFGAFYEQEGQNLQYLGLDLSLFGRRQIRFVEGTAEIDKEITLFAGVEGRRFYSAANDSLMQMQGGKLVQDEFLHEQNLVITTGERKRVLLAGCAHKGIVNILDRFHALFGGYPDLAIGGFHLSMPGHEAYQQDTLIDEMADALLATGTQFYTCHCTGQYAYERLKARMGERIGYFAGGMRIEI